MSALWGLNCVNPHPGCLPVQSKERLEEQSLGSQWDGQELSLGWGSGQVAISTTRAWNFSSPPLSAPCTVCMVSRKLLRDPLPQACLPHSPMPTIHCSQSPWLLALPSIDLIGPALMDPLVATILSLPRHVPDVPTTLFPLYFPLSFFLSCLGLGTLGTQLQLQVTAPAPAFLLLNSDTFQASDTSSFYQRP